MCPSDRPYREGHVTCPAAISTQNHRKRLKRWWASKEWKEYVRVHTEGKTCKVCGCAKGQVKGNRKPATLTINHLYRDQYNSFEEYLKWEGDKQEVTCTSCNWMYEDGYDICPVCLSDTVAKYKKFYQPMCISCYHKANPHIKAERKAKADAAKALQKKLRDAEKEKAKEWKRKNPKKKETWYCVVCKKTTSTPHQHKLEEKPEAGVLSDLNWT